MFKLGNHLKKDIHEIEAMSAYTLNEYFAYYQLYPFEEENTNTAKIIQAICAMHGVEIKLEDISLNEKKKVYDPALILANMQAYAEAHNRGLSNGKN